MFNIGDTVLYAKEGVCCISNIEQRKFANETRRYYVLKSLDRINSTVYVPTDNERLVSAMRRVLSKQEIDDLIERIHSSSAEWLSDDMLRKEEYHRIISNADCLALGINLRILHLKREELRAGGKKLRRFDEEFFIQAQNLLFNEFAHVLKISKEEVLPYILNHE